MDLERVPQAPVNPVTNVIIIFVCCFAPTAASLAAPVAAPAALPAADHVTPLFCSGLYVIYFPREL